MGDEILQIRRGVLGPIREFPPGGLKLYPFTLFIGKQGTGKSLVSQILYFFRNLPFLVRFYRTHLGTDAGPEAIVRNALDELRSARRAFGVFAAPSVSVVYIPAEGRAGLGIGMDRRNRRIVPHQRLREQIERLVREGKGTPLGDAVYIPAERVLYSHARGPDPWVILSAPSTLRRFATILEEVGETFANWPNGEPDTAEGRWVRAMGRQALAGEAYRVGDYWKWDYGGEERLDIDMASSGQKANWPIVLLAEALFSWRRDREIPPDFALHVEEPEIHLHPDAQVAMVKILAYLVNHGFRVLVTTHSLIVLYTLNNLLAASEVEAAEPGIPEPEVRLKPGMVGAYFFGEDGVVKTLVDEETGWISEAELAETGERLLVVSPTARSKFKSLTDFFAYIGAVSSSEKR
ncbi:MAG: ATP-binding protein [Anaerolineae bacterium]|nr:ATP-binding protein [Anaerolineae bacterium]